MIFQDPISSLNPRRKVDDIVAEGLKIWPAGPQRPGDGSSRCSKRWASIPQVGRDRRPHELSGGQCQRVCIARALMLDPKLLICDESVSALDVSVQAQILNLLEDMKDRYGLTMIFISHDLAVVKHVSDRVMVMYLGKVCEVAPPDDLYTAPAHPYTSILLASIPKPDPFRAIPASRSPVTCLHRSTRRRGAGSGPVARRRPRSAPPRSRSSARSGPIITWLVTSPISPRCRSTEAEAERPLTGHTVWRQMELRREPNRTASARPRPSAHRRSAAGPPRAQRRDGRWS